MRFVRCLGAELVEKRKLNQNRPDLYCLVGRLDFPQPDDLGGRSLSLVRCGYRRGGWGDLRLAENRRRHEYDSCLWRRRRPRNMRQIRPLSDRIAARRGVHRHRFGLFGFDHFSEPLGGQRWESHMNSISFVKRRRYRRGVSQVRGGGRSAVVNKHLRQGTWLCAGGSSCLRS